MRRFAIVLLGGALVVSGCTEPGSSVSTPINSSVPIETDAPISVTGAPTTSLDKQVRTATTVDKPGVPEVAFGSVWFQTAPGDLVRLDPATGKVEQTYPTACLRLPRATASARPSVCSGSAGGQGRTCC